MPPFRSPDIARRLQKQAASGIDFFGQSISLRKYISASGGVPEAGVGDTWQYQARPLVVDLRELTFDELQAIGGQTDRGGFEVWSREQISPRDEFVYPPNGDFSRTYRCVGFPIPENIGSTLFWRSTWVIGEVTGQY